jgi:nucleoside-diphosphate-sugar epimerase
VRADSVLIANTKSGGHAFIGLHLAKQLLSAGHQVTILNDGDQAKQTAKAPFSQYKNLEQQGATVVWGNPADAGSIPDGDFDIVYDNNGKSMDACQPMIDHFKGKVSHYVFVGSAGAYVPRKYEAGHVEGDERKASAGHVEVENYLEQQDLPYTVFQPLYIYGPHTAKDCEQWFFERVLRDRPVPIPAPGVQLTSISHVEDVAAMLAKVPGNKAAIKQHFNVCSDRCISFDGIVQTVAKAAGKDAKIVHYDDGKTGLKKGQGFPFRTVHFFAHSDKAKHVLDWQPQHDFISDLPQLLDAFKSSGRLDKEFDASTDDAILKSEAVLA